MGVTLLEGHVPGVYAHLTASLTLRISKTDCRWNTAIKEKQIADSVPEMHFSLGSSVQLQCLFIPVLPPALHSPVRQLTWVKIATMWVNCFAQEHNPAVP